MTTEQDFQDMLDRNPEDHATRLILADFLQERGDPRWEGYRALGLLMILPEDYGGIYSWTWWRRSGFPEGTDVGMVIDNWFDLIEGERTAGSDCRDYRARQTAEDAAALAFSKLSDGEKGEILNGVLGTVN